MYWISYIIYLDFRTKALVEIWRKCSTLFDGMDRHQWGMVHLIFGFILMGPLVVHIFLYWNTITCIYKK
ncbi:DUF4405 domain-containing protein [Yeosuana sp.]|uniref:DUF4405 domain-containing protein n=1 Tax=Yeosuana sp. TaxID=2529388 RepID=UPI004054FA9E